ncbi:MAG: PHB depolymerase family esterase, partial [Actinomycetota bacterium]|nr:PHB depolymerase family esterase [Actinomycetota bacterium]
MISRVRKRAIGALLAAGLAVAGLAALAPAAQAITCPPGFETLPGCTNGGGGSGGGSTGGTGTWTTETIAGMSVRLYTPTTAAALPAGRALMISLHGCVQKASDLQSAGNWAQTADEYGMVVALPDAPNGGV